ncbi:MULTISPECIES: hypothetical protein [Streptococcus]|uniref:hypothetical protein n=1 Tax=Streptococcus TaxID=1301 RepID=UPI002096D87E|nr:MULTISPECIES: hypothetical protein [Streptococcus]MCO7182201.1 hypothetical protein [Streptococcus gallolyticus]
MATPSWSKTLQGYRNIFSLKHIKNNNNFNNDFKYNKNTYLKSQENTMVKAIVGSYRRQMPFTKVNSNTTLRFLLG